VYDLDGRASQLSLGALIETLDIAASNFGLGTEVVRRGDMPDATPTLDIKLIPQGNRPASSLVAAIPARSVFRRPMQLRAIEAPHRLALAASVGPDHQLLMFQSWGDRLRWASLLWANAGLRLRLPEAFEVHRRVIQWHARFSPDRIPDQALGASGATLAMMRLAMASWARVDFLNTWLGGTIAPRFEMDWIPALACGAHIAIVAKKLPANVDDHLAAGRVVQRFWLTATSLGLLHQPAITPVIFGRYVREGRTFTADSVLQTSAVKLYQQLGQLLGANVPGAIWLGRLGHGLPAQARSERKPLASITVQAAANGGSTEFNQRN
jgi:hypothetical protein